MVSRILTILIASSAVLIFAIWAASSEPATINWTDLHQQIDGFGGSSADFLNSLTPTQADFFFTRTGIGLSILRTQIIPNVATCDIAFQKDGCSNSNGQILNGELGTAQLAAARGATVFSTPWSPPGSYKTNGEFKEGGSLLRSHYSDWAKDIADYVATMKKNGVPLFAVSVQNEPDLTTDYGSCRYTAQEIHDFVPYLYSALQSGGVGATRIMIAEQSSWAFDLTSAAMADPKVAPEVGIIAAHGYRGNIQPYSTGSARLWQTEDSSQSAIYDSGMADGLSWALKIHGYLTVANVNAWVWWFLTDMPRQGEGADNAALTDINGNIPKRAYVTGQWSKFVRPGWYRIGVGYSGPLKISAFKDPAGQAFAIVVVNPDRSPVTQSFSLNGFSTKSVTPWVTSSSSSLIAQTRVPIRGATFVYNVPRMSVTTLTGDVAKEN